MNQNPFPLYQHIPLIAHTGYSPPPQHPKLDYEHDNSFIVPLWDWHLIFRNLHQLLPHQCSLILDIGCQACQHHLLEYLSPEGYHKTVIFLLLLLLLLLVISFLDWTVILLLYITV